MLAEARNRIQKWIYDGNKSKPLDLCKLNLVELPEIPYGVEMLFCTYNKLTSLPDNLPITLKQIYCINNQLTSLPETLPPNLEKISCSYNKITKLPEKLPLTLKEIYCDSNKLEDLPESLPESLHLIYCANNKFKSLPEKISPTLSIWCHGDENKIPERNEKEDFKDYHARVIGFVKGK